MKLGSDDERKFFELYTLFSEGWHAAKRIDLSSGERTVPEHRLKYRAQSYPLDLRNFEALADLLQDLGERGDTVAIHGAVRAAATEDILRRSVRRNGEDGTILDTPTPFFALDIDGAEIPG